MFLEYKMNQTKISSTNYAFISNAWYNNTNTTYRLWHNTTQNEIQLVDGHLVEEIPLQSSRVRQISTIST